MVWTPPQRFIIAHRGDRLRGHENTLMAIEFAIGAGADMVEVDVRRTRDGVCVLHHDDKLGRARLAERTVEQIRGQSRALGFEIPVLGDVLGAIAGRIQIDIELKEAGCEAQVLREIHDSGFRLTDLVVSSFLPDAVAAIKALEPAITAGLLIDRPVDLSDAAMAGRAPDFIAPHIALVDRPFIQAAARGGHPLLVWTVNDANRLRWLFQEPAVWGVVTDDPSFALSVRRETVAPRK